MRKLRVLSMILALLILMSTNSFAAESLQAKPYTEADRLSNIVAFLTNNLPNYLQSDMSAFEKSSFAALSVGSKIQEYELIDNELVRSPCHRFPVLSGGKVIATVVAFQVGNTARQEEYQLSTEFVETINALPEKTAYAIVYDCSGIHLMTSNTYYTITELPFDHHRTSINDFMNTINPTEITVFLESEYTCSKAIEFSPHVTPRGTGSCFLTVPVYYQGSLNLCWAYSVAAIGNYSCGYEKYTGTEIAQIRLGSDNNHGKSIEYARETLEILYSLNYTISTGTLPETFLYDLLLFDAPVMAHYEAISDSERDHMVVISGINTNTHTFTVVNSGLGQTQTQTNTYGTYRIYYNSTSWDLKKWGFDQDIYA